MIWRCPACGHSRDVTLDLVGAEVRCPECGIVSQPKPEPGLAARKIAEQEEADGRRHLNLFFLVAAFVIVASVAVGLVVARDNADGRAAARFFGGFFCSLVTGVFFLLWALGYISPDKWFPDAGTKGRGTKWPLNHCHRCGHDWFPKAQAHSPRCPHCKARR